MTPSKQVSVNIFSYFISRVEPFFRVVGNPSCLSCGSIACENSSSGPEHTNICHE